jgi:meiotically up-regulated gene 157 (Mug157) protein
LAVSVLEKAAKILDRIDNTALAADCRSLATEVNDALQKYAIVEHPKYGKIYAFEVDGYGSHLLMDDANAPGLLSLPFLDCMPVDDPIYQNTRRFVWSEDNPYFFRGTAGEGIGGPHVGYDMVWPMSIIIKAYTTDNDEEICQCLTQIMNTDAGLGFIHESFNKDNPERFTRSWMAWANTIFGQLIVKLVNDGKADLLNSLPMPNHMPKPVETKKN